MSARFNETRVDLMMWRQLEEKQEQGIVMFLSEYFEAKGSTGSVTILSNFNDEPLATNRVRTGVTIRR